MDFVHLHVHSHYSILDGLIKIDDLVSKLKEYIEKIEDSYEIDFEYEESKSESEWDKYLFTTRPETPTALSDFLTLQFEFVDQFRMFWIGFMAKQPRSFKSNLLDWLKLQYEDLSGNKCILPAWL